jgi:hypothetical protein
MKGTRPRTRENFIWFPILRAYSEFSRTILDRLSCETERDAFIPPNNNKPGIARMLKNRGPGRYFLSQRPHDVLAANS